MMIKHDVYELDVRKKMMYINNMCLQNIMHM